MRKRLAITAGAAALVVAIAMPTLATGATRITTTMTGSEIVNPNGGDPDGTAKLVLRVNRVKERICFRLKSEGLSTVTGAFIHKGEAGQIARRSSPSSTPRSPGRERSPGASTTSAAA